MAIGHRNRQTALGKDIATEETLGNRPPSSGAVPGENPRDAMLTGYTYRGTTPAYSLPAIRDDCTGKRLNT
jgi:hypothetical protein